MRTGSPASLPELSKDAEKWRYERLKIHIEEMDLDPKHEFRHQYNTHLRETINKIAKELDNMLPITKNERQQVTDLVNAAAKWWLKVIREKYRVVLLVTDSSCLPASSGKESLDPGRKLIVVPELRRFGNAQGDRLDKNELVMNCRGKFHVIPSF